MFVSVRYRERLKMKYPCRMDTKNWKFVKDGLDDFRDGLPPSHDSIILEVISYSSQGHRPVCLFPSVAEERSKSRCFFSNSSN